jgi:uncharacterized protein (DUF1697 family)
VNVGGTGKVSMADLKAAFESAGMESVRTYINSGNVIFEAEGGDRATLTDRLERAVRDRVGLEVGILLKDLRQMRAIVGAIPARWKNDASMKCDVVFLWKDVDRPDLVDELGPRPGIEDALYVSGAVVWRVDRKDATRNRLTRMVGTPTYKRVTVRNCNTARKLLELMEQ